MLRLLQEYLQNTPVNGCFPPVLLVRMRGLRGRVRGQRAGGRARGRGARGRGRGHGPQPRKKKLENQLQEWLEDPSNSTEAVLHWRGPTANWADCAGNNGRDQRRRKECLEIHPSDTQTTTFLSASVTGKCSL